MSPNNFALFTESFGKRIKHAVELSEQNNEARLPTENNARHLASYTTPVEITETWIVEGSVWKCRAKRLWRINNNYCTIDGEVEFDLYHPTAREQPTQGVGERVFAVFRGVWELVSGAAVGGTSPTPSTQTATVILPLCRSINPHAQGDWNVPFDNILEDTQYNSRSHYAAACGYIAIDGKTYTPSIDHTDDDGTIHYHKALRVRSDIDFDCFGSNNIDGANAHYTTIGKLQRPVIEYIDGSGEWTPWNDDFTWETTTDSNLAWKNYDIAACKTLDYSEVLVPGENVKVAGSETHNYYKVVDDELVTESKNVILVEPPEKYTVQFEGCATVNEFGIWNKERKLTTNTADVVNTTIDENYTIGEGETPYQYWGFDAVPLLPNGNAAWAFIDIVAVPQLTIVSGSDSCYNTNHVSRPVLSNDVFIQNTACNTRAYGLWYKTDKDGLRYPILCSVETLTFGTGIETRKSYCNTDCDTSWTVFEFIIERTGNRLKLPTAYCSVTCPIES